MTIQDWYWQRDNVEEERREIERTPEVFEDQSSTTRADVGVRIEIRQQKWSLWYVMEYAANPTRGKVWYGGWFALLCGIAVLIATVAAYTAGRVGGDASGVLATLGFTLATVAVPFIAGGQTSYSYGDPTGIAYYTYVPAERERSAGTTFRLRG